MARLGCVALLLVLGSGCTILDDTNHPFPQDPLPDAGAADAYPLGPTYGSLRANIFVPRCMNVCHSGGDFAAGSFDMAPEPRDAMVDDSVTPPMGIPAMGRKCTPPEGPAGMIRVVPGDPGASLLYLKVSAKAAGTMPPCGEGMPHGTDRPPLTQEEMDAIAQWITDGALP